MFAARNSCARAGHSGCGKGERICPIQGAEPRDIHLKNVLMQDGRAKVLDVSEYVKEGDDKRWEHLVWAYHTFYSGISEVKVPSWILDTIKKWYYKLDNSNFNLEEFAQRASQLFSKWRS